MSMSRRRSDRPDPARRRIGSSLEALESRELLSGTAYHFYQPLPYGVPVHAQSVNLPGGSINHPIGTPESVLAGLDNDGKLISGRDRNGNEYTITVHGPGVVIVTDATPNDGVLDDDIDSIQIVGSDPNKTYVSGQSKAGALVQTNGTVFFNRLIAQNGVKSIILNGFILTQTLNTAAGAVPNANTGVFLPGGAHDLEFTGVEVGNDTSTGAGPINIVIGDPSTPLRYKPSLRIDRIVNTVFDSTATTASTTPVTTPSVNIVVNSSIHNIQFVSAGQQTIPAAFQFLFPITGTTGRTSIQTKGIDNLKFTGGATNVTASRTAQPFTGSFNSLNHLGTADFGGPTDAVGLDVKGKVKGIRFAKGAGSPVGLIQTATTFGTPDAQVGYPGRGDVGVLVSAGSIGHVKIAPADVILQTSNNPALIQQGNPGSTTFYPRAGHALNGSAIVTSGSIGSVTMVGDANESEIKTGFNLNSYNQGLQSTRGKSAIGKLHVRGSLVDSAISSSFSPNSANVYGGPGSKAGNGTITGSLKGTVISTGDQSVLGNSGSGVFARHKHGYLPPPSAPTRIHKPGSKLNGVNKI